MDSRKILRVTLCDDTIAYLAPQHIVGITPSYEYEDSNKVTEVYYVGSDKPFYVKEPLEQLQARWAELL